MRLGPRGNLVLFALCVPSASPLAYTHPHRHSGSLDLSPFNSDGGKVEGKYTRKHFVRRFFCIPATFAIKEWGRGWGCGVTECTGKHHRGGVPQRVDRPTTCLAALGPNDSLFDTLSDSGALPGTSALG